jgi:rhodanese-related sulfurtransferase
MKKILLALAYTTIFTTGHALAESETKPQYKTPELNAAQIDEWLAKPDQVLVIDIRRPDELIKYGSFPAFLSIQYEDLEKYAAFIPKDRHIITVSNRAGRAFKAGDLLSNKGFKVVGAAGSEQYEQQGGKSVAIIQPRERKPATTAAVAQ